MARVFSGSIQSKRKGELQEIAVALGARTEGTKEELQTRIRKYLDDNPHFAVDPSFSSLDIKRKKSLQPQPIIPRSAALPVSESTNETITKSSESPMHTRSRRRTSGAAAIVHEATPIPEAREVSMMLKNPPFSPEGISGSHTGVDMPSRDDKGVLLTSTPRNMLPNFSKPSVVVTTTAMKKWQSNIQEAAHKLLTISRLVLSKSINIWLISALLELVRILYVIIPWKIVEILPPQKLSVGSSPFTLPYPSLAVLTSPAFWAILLHWAMPSIVLPAVFGSLVSFYPSNSVTARIPRASFFDPLTASIMRLAAQYAYPYDALGLCDQGLDVLGFRWRIFDACVVAALAFAEAIVTTPWVHAEARLRQRVPPRRGAPLQNSSF